MTSIIRALALLPLLSTLRGVAAAPLEVNHVAVRQNSRTDYSIQEIVSMFQSPDNPDADDCVFYHGSFLFEALEYAYQQGKVTLYDIYSRSDVNAFDVNADPFLSYRNAGLTRKWYEDTSRAYATRCTGNIYFVWDGVQPFRRSGRESGRQAWTSIWLTDELPQLMSQGIPIGNVFRVDPSDFSVTQYNGATSKRDAKAVSGPILALDKREPEPDYTRFKDFCLDDDGCIEYVLNIYDNNPNVEGSVFSYDEDYNVYVPGYCGIHITQHQKPDPSTDSYTYDPDMYDADQNPIGNTTGLVSPTGQPVSFLSALPSLFNITSGAVDDDPVMFAYDDQTWTSNDPQCSVGAYDSGARQMDCGFTC